MSVYERACGADSANTFPTWWDAYREALFRAAITHRRYRVTQDSANGLWSITEMAQRWDGQRPNVLDLFWGRLW